MPKSYISGNDFRSSTISNYIGYKSYVFDIRYQKILENSPAKKVEYKIQEVIPAGIYGYALVLLNILVSKSSDGHGHFVFILVSFIFFMTLSFSFLVNSVFLSIKASIKRSGNLSIF